MKAARLYGARDLRVEDVAAPTVRPGQVLVRPRAISVCGSDLHYYREGGIGESRTAQPLVLGHEMAGEIVALGPTAAAHVGHEAAGTEERAALRPGMAVAIDPAMPCGHCEYCLEGNPNVCPQVRFAGTPPTDGGLQELLAWPSSLLYPLPGGMDLETGALLEPLGVAIHALDLAHVRLAQRVAVLGTGTIGLLVCQMARLAGASRVFATDLLPARLAAAQDFGAHETIDAGAADAVQVIRDRTGGAGVDVVIECAGAPETPRQAVELVKPGGTVVLVGIPSDDRTTFPASPARRKGVTIKLSRRMKHVYPRAMALVEAGMVDLSRLVSHRFPLAQSDAAFLQLDEDPAVIKAVIEVSP